MEHIRNIPYALDISFLCLIFMRNFGVKLYKNPGAPKNIYLANQKFKLF